MQMLIQVLNTLVGLYIYALILRFILRASDADFYNPVTQAIIKITNPWSNLFRVIPTIKQRLDLGVFVSAIVLQILLIMLLLSLSHAPLDIAAVVIISLYKILLTLINVYFWSLIILVILSWVMMLGSNATGIEPLYILLDQITQPMLRPIQRILPDFGGIDISPIFAILALQILEYIVRSIFMSFI